MAIFKTIEDFLRKSVYTGPLAKEKPTRAPGSKGYKPTDTSGKKFKPAYMKTVKTKTAGKISKGNGNPYTPTQLKPVGPDMGKVNRNTKGNSVPGTAAVKKKAPVNPALISKNTPSGINRMDKTKDKDKTKKRFRAGPQMASMGGMRKSGTLRGKYVQ
jgi:hypothetical protein